MSGGYYIMRATGVGGVCGRAKSACCRTANWRRGGLPLRARILANFLKSSESNRFGEKDRKSVRERARESGLLVPEMVIASDLRHRFSASQRPHGGLAAAGSRAAP